MASTNLKKFIWAVIALVALGGVLRADKNDREDIREKILSGDEAAAGSWLAPVIIASEPLHIYDEKNSVRFHPSGKVYVVFKDNIDDGATNKRSIKLYSYDGEKSVMVKNVSEDSQMAYEPDMAITPTGIIHIVWAEALSGNANTQHVKYRTFDGATWSPIITLRTFIIDGTTGGWNPEKIDDLRLAVDNDENVFVTCMLWPIARGVTFSRYGETVYNDEFPMSGRSKHPSIAADKDSIHLTWQQLEGSEYTIRYARRENKPQSKWTFTYAVASSGGHRPFIKVDSNDVPHLVYMKDAPSSTKRELHHRQWKGNTFGGSWMTSDAFPDLYHTPVLGALNADNVLTHTQTWGGGVENFYNWKVDGKWSGLRIVNVIPVGSSFSDCDLHSNGIGAISYSAGGSMQLLLSGKLQINTIPVAKFTVDKDSVYWGETIKMNGSESYDPDGSVVKFEWRCVTDGVTLPSTTATAEYTFLKKWNNVRMRLIAIDDKGGRGIAEKVITVKALYSALDVVATPKLITTLVYNRMGNVVTWKANPKNSEYTIASYRIYSKVAGSDDSTYELKGTVGADKFAFGDVKVEQGKNYVYAVSAVDAEGHQSPYVNPGT